MIEISITMDEDQVKELDSFGQAAPKLLDKTLFTVGKKYEGYVRRSFLSGQMLGVVTGETRRKGVWTKKSKYNRHEYLVTARLANIFEHAGGVDIEPKGMVWRATGEQFYGIHGRRRRKLQGSSTGRRMLRWVDPGGAVHWARRVHLAPRPFMTLSSSWFAWDLEFDSATEEVFQKEIDKRGLNE